MMKFVLVIFAVLALTQCKSLKARDSIQVQLYYESFCPSCTDFIKGDFHDTYHDLGSSIMKLELILIAEESVLANGTIEFKCLHGPKECYGNKVHSCALGLHPIEIAESYIHCLEKTGGSADPILIQQCAKDVNISWNDIDDCMSNGQAEKLFSDHVKKTKAAGFIQFAPTVVFDGEYSEDVAMDAFYDFRTVICKKLGQPEGCKKK